MLAQYHTSYLNEEVKNGITEKYFKLASKLRASRILQLTRYNPQVA